MQLVNQVGGATNTNTTSGASNGTATNSTSSNTTTAVTNTTAPVNKGPYFKAYRTVFNWGMLLACADAAACGHFVCWCLPECCCA